MNREGGTREINVCYLYENNIGINVYEIVSLYQRNQYYLPLPKSPPVKEKESSIVRPVLGMISETSKMSPNV